MKRKQVLLTYNGITKTIKEWGEEYGQPPTRIYKRMARGWPPERILKEPPKRPKQFEYEGKLYKASELAKINGDVASTTVYRRIVVLGKSVKEAVETPNQRPSIRHPELRKKMKGKPEFCCDPDCDKCPYAECAW